MNEVEKMYRNSGIEKCNRFLKPCPFGNECDGCEHNWYPEFTAEKQLEIVKFLLHKGIYYNTDGDTYWFHYTDEIENATYRPFKEAIAEFINGFWQDLTDAERTQIKEILE
jgi:hypothetical protein